MIQFNEIYDIPRYRMLSNAVRNAYLILNGHTYRNEFWNLLPKIDMFTYSKTVNGTPVTGQYIQDLLANNDYIINVDVYTTRNPWSSVVAAYQDKTIYLNTRRLNRQPEQLVATICHEFFHHADFIDQNASFGHGDNNWKGKEYSCPYYLQILVEKAMRSYHA